MNSKLIRAKKQGGLSLVEIMVAMVISIFLLGGVIQVFSANKATYSFSEAMSRIQENGRFAMDTMTQDLRMAGFMGCATFDPTDPSNVVNNLNPEDENFEENYDFLDSPAIEGLNENEGLNGSDSFALYGPVPSQTNILPPFGPGTSANVKITATEAVTEGDIVLLTNCKGADIFQITNVNETGNSSQLAVVHNTGGDVAPGNYNPDNCNAGHCLSQVYGGDAALMKLQKITYTIEAGESGEPALFKTVFDVKSELVEGIEQMQILYGLNTDPVTTDRSPDQYLTSDKIEDDQWNSVTAVRIMLLVKSDNNVSMDTQKYNYNGETGLVAGDRRLRQVFSTTIALRNRI